MSHLIWKAYIEDDVEKFESLLSPAASGGHHAARTTTPGANNLESSLGNAALATSPRGFVKMRKSSGHIQSTLKMLAPSFSRADINTRDHMGLTLLHRAVTISGGNGYRFAAALLQHPSIDIYVQDLENGWTALHRALYFGNISIARMLMEKDLKDSTGHGTLHAVARINPLIKIKDHEGNSAFDVYNSTIARRNLADRMWADGSGIADDDGDAGSENGLVTNSISSEVADVGGDELFAFGSNKNLTLGFGDEDDRQHPERISLKRPDHLLHRFHREALAAKAASGHAQFPGQDIGAPNTSIATLPALIKGRPIVIQDAALSKLHSAILTTDPESNLYMCGFGPGGRLGTGDDTTRFSYVCIEGGSLAGKKIIAIALGQNHSVCVSSEGEIFSWGTNTWGQLGYTLPKPAGQDEEPMNNIPRQIFGSLKREAICGVAASNIHSVAFTPSSLFTWGRNAGQLGLMDSDSRSLEAQLVPRKVAASLFTTSILSVSAIDKATICLLANHSVCVFTNYGYNYVKFPLHGDFVNYHLNSTPSTTRYEAESHITAIASGGETIAALSSRGDLFTFNVNQSSVANATSTTNPAKIKSALSIPQKIWSLRKGHWDGVKSVGVGENGSVIICTHAGAVWRRVKRPKVKDSFAVGAADYKKKDYKFQRVPGLTHIAAVRCNIFGAYAAIRKDCDVTRTQIVVEPQSLWHDLASLLDFDDFVPSDSANQIDGSQSKFWSPALSEEHFPPFKRAVLSSQTLESDITEHLRNLSDDACDVELASTLSEARIPVHGFMLAARSGVLRNALVQHRRNGSYHLMDTLTTRNDGHRILVEFLGLDFVTILNLALYIYQDSIIDVWHFTRHVPTAAYRFRQIRTELMKVAIKLNMMKLEHAVRLMVEPEPQLHRDFASAIQHDSYFDDADVVIQLSGDSVPVHSALLCRRCPFFEGLFNGRAGGQWLVERKELDVSKVTIDLQHIEPATFAIVLRYLYADIGIELFDDIVASDLDELCDIVMEIMAVANELMLDRLSEICQQVLGRFVTTRNVCQLINVIAPCSVTSFKDVGLEYICLQLESMLENHLLHDLDADLLGELDEVVKGNQVACLPFAKSGRADLLLHESNPTLAVDLDDEKQRRVRDMAFRAQLRDEDHRLPNSYRARVGSLDDILSSSPQEKVKKKSKPPRNAPFSPALRPKDSTVDLMFDMDEEPSRPTVPGTPRNAGMVTGRSSSTNGTATASPTRHNPTISSDQLVDHGQSPTIPSPFLPPMTPLSPPTPGYLDEITVLSSAASRPWMSAPLSSNKLDMKEIMAQASTVRTSTLSMGISAEKNKGKEDAVGKMTPQKLSQKERKKQQQQQQTTPTVSSPSASISKDKTSSSPWQVVSGAKTSLKDVQGQATAIAAPQLAVPTPSESPLTASNLAKRRTASPDTRFAGQARSSAANVRKLDHRSASTNVVPSSASDGKGPRPGPTAPYSKSYTAPQRKPEPSLLLSMSDIIGQQKREQDLIKEAVAKRSLQEIQEEQAFQEWWDAESRRTQEAEAGRTPAVGTPSGSHPSSRSKGTRRGRGASRGRGGAIQPQASGRERSKMT